MSARTPLDPTPPEVKLSSAKRWGIALLIVGGLVVAVNISHANEAPAPKPAATTTAPAPAPEPTIPAPAAEPEPAPALAPEPAPAPESQDNGTQAHTWIKDNYPGTSWLDNITSIREQGDVLWAETDLFPDSDAERPASAICAALSAYQLSETEGFTGVTVRAVDGQRLAWRMSLSDPC